MDKIELQAEKREILGKKTRKLREQGLVPAILYGHNFKSLPIQVKQKDFEKIYEEAGESTLVYIRVGGESFPTIIHDIATDPISDNITHADFYKVKLDEKITAKVPLVFTGESAAVRDLGGILVKNINEIEVEAFPQNLPHNIEVNISSLSSFENRILVRDLMVGEGVEIKDDPGLMIALIQQPISQEELEKQLEVSAVTPEEVEVIKKEEKEGAVEEEAEKTEKAEQKESPNQK